MLAYSSVYNVGLMLVGIAVGTQMALSATIFHILNHEIAKASMFICAGAFIKEAKTREIEKMIGIGTKMKITGTIFTITAFYIASFPPLGMFWSKLYLIEAAIGSSQQVNWVGIMLAILIVVNSVISIGYYYGVLVKKIVFVPKNEILKDVREASEKSKTILASEIILLVIMLLVSIFSIIIFDIIKACVISFLSIYS